LAEYLSLIAGSVALMFALLEIGFNIGTPQLIDTGDLDTMDFLKVFFILSGFAMGFLVITLMMGIAAENAASSNLQNILSVGLYVWGVLFFAIMAAFVIYYVWWVPTKLKSMTQQKQKRYDEDID
jgi:hypothetical protein